MRKNNEQTLGEAIKQLLESNPFMKQKMNELNIVDLWDKKMGRLIASNTKSISLRKSVLYVEVKSAALKSEMSYNREKIIGIMNEALGELVITDIQFR